MTFTALESLLLASLLSCVVGIVVRSRSVTPHECEERRKVTDIAFLRLAEAIESLKISNDIQFRMLRATVMHLYLPAKEKTEILNMRPTE